MPIFEYQCPQCLQKIERFTQGHMENRYPPLCETCGIETEQIEFSVPAKRDPNKGIQN